MDLIYKSGLIILIVSLISAGQLLFKLASLLIVENNPVFGFKVLGVIFLSFLISGIGSLVYISLLRTIPLSIAYPFMALSYIAVPIMSYVFYNDSININYYVGITFVIVGLIVITHDFG